MTVKVGENFFFKLRYNNKTMRVFKVRSRDNPIWFVKLRNSEIISRMPNVKSMFGSNDECDEYSSNSFIIIRPVKLCSLFVPTGVISAAGDV